MRIFLSRRRLKLFVAGTIAGTSFASATAQELTESLVTNPATEFVTEEVTQDGVAQIGFIDETVLGHKAKGCACGACKEKVCCTDKEKEELTEKAKGAYKGVFYANDYSYLDDPCYEGHNLGDSFKRLADGKLDLGGEARVRYHSEENMRGLGLTGRDDEFWLTRYRTFANYRINDTFRFYGEYLYADSAGETFAARPIEENRGEAQNLFVDAKLLETDSGKLSARVGRQELLLGSQRLVSPLDWGNTRRTFDGFRLMYSGDNWDVDGFYTNPAKRIAANVERWDSADSLEDFFGVYATRKGLDIGVVDAYYIGHTNDNPGTEFDYHTMGSRVAGGKDWLYEVEGGVQFGNEFGGESEASGLMAAGLGRKLAIGDWTPTVWAWYDWAGGDDNGIGRNNNGFDHAFPLAHRYNGFMDLFGRRNLNDVNCQFITPVFGKKVTMLLWYHYFFLDQATTPYSVVMSPYNTAGGAGSKDLGHEIDLLFTVNLDTRNSVLLGYSYFNSGDYFDTPNAALPAVNSDVDAQFMYFQYQTQI